MSWHVAPVLCCQLLASSALCSSCCHQIMQKLFIPDVRANMPSTHAHLQEKKKKETQKKNIHWFVKGIIHYTSVLLINSFFLCLCTSFSLMLDKEQESSIAYKESNVTYTAV